MLAMAPEVKVYVAVGATDMRKSINGLSLLVEEHFQLDLFSGSLFAFKTPGLRRLFSVVRIRLYKPHLASAFQVLSESIVRYGCPRYLIP